jgi:predicted nucleic acid-binding protein
MPVLLDTNILLRLMQPHSADAPIAEKAILCLRAKSETLQITAQNLVEFWAVATRQVIQNGLGLTVQQAMAEIQSFKQFFVLLPELPLQSEWERLVTTYGVSGKNSHDARLVAAMLVHGTTSILTFNMQDFNRYGEITVLDPRRVI